MCYRRLDIDHLAESRRKPVNPFGLGGLVAFDEPVNEMPMLPFDRLRLHRPGCPQAPNLLDNMPFPVRTRYDRDCMRLQQAYLAHYPGNHTEVMEAAALISVPLTLPQTVDLFAAFLDSPFACSQDPLSFFTKVEKVFGKVKRFGCRNGVAGLSYDPGELDTALRGVVPKAPQITHRECPAST